ncbi:MAG TPA: response regulator [Caulobacteraceae bacterium]|jgi:DNA-directed RNA polymerase specialized sigma24 family protein|nr:response regulator [Caulobacteraceae bacterium]
MPKQIIRQAPYLRRYARALTGAQALGDGLVQTMMEGLLAGTVRLASDLSFRASLYRALVATWRGAHPSISTPGQSGADQRLQTLDPERRAALLLVAMEGFDAAEAAQVMDLAPEEMERLLTEAQAELEAELTTDVLIIEDEPIIALDLTRLVRELGHRVTGAAATRDEAVALAEEAPPGLVLADIRLADGSNGMDAAADILRRHDVPVIFITAFPEHLLTGERPEPAFLITKPFREEAVKALIGQALFFHTPAAERRIA